MQQLLVVAIVLASLAVLHALLLLLLWRGKWSDGSKPLPKLLVFPRMEIIVMTTTVMTVSEAFGSLLSTLHR